MFFLHSGCNSCITASCLDDELSGETINIGPDEEVVTINQLADKVSQLIDPSLKPVYIPGRPKEVLHAICSSSKARKLLDYGTKVSLKDGLQSMIDYISDRGVLPFERHLPVEIVNSRTPKTWITDLMND